MPRKRTSQSNTTLPKIPLAQPKRTPDPSKETLIEWAKSRDLFKDSLSDPKAPIGDIDGEAGEEYQVGRLAESILWSLSLAMAHFTLDFLVQHQYAQEMEVWKLAFRTLQTFPVILLFFYVLHPHSNGAVLHELLPLAKGREEELHMVLFFVGSVASGCYLIHITNMYSYYAVMKQAAPVGCVWIWSVVELSLIPAVISLLCCLVFLFWGDYAFL